MRQEAGRAVCLVRQVAQLDDQARPVVVLAMPPAVAKLAVVRVQQSAATPAADLALQVVVLQAEQDDPAQRVVAPARLPGVAKLAADLALRAVSQPDAREQQEVVPALQLPEALSAVEQT